MKIRLMTAIVLAVLFGAPLGVRAEEIPADKQKAILDMLATMECEVNPANIKSDAEGYETRRCVLLRWAVRYGAQR